MNCEKGSTAPALAKEVIRHFLRNPHSADTVEGVARWRLLQEKVSYTVEEAEKALEWLVERGLVSETRRLGSPPLFRLNPEKTAEAKSFLEQMEGGKGRTDR